MFSCAPYWIIWKSDMGSRMAGQPYSLNSVFEFQISRLVPPIVQPETGSALITRAQKDTPHWQRSSLLQPPGVRSFQKQHGEFHH